MEYFLGVDGGATSTALAICDREGRVLGIGHGGPSNHILAPGGEARARQAVETALDAAATAAGLRRIEFESAQLGMTG
ncbi:MAG: ATPase, partial [Bacillati bacterium ANGP1]